MDSVLIASDIAGIAGYSLLAMAGIVASVVVFFKAVF